MNEYGASECLSISHECAAGWQHLHAEWVILEPVRRDGTPAAPGELSHSVLLTNLANRVQPIIRYDLGDRVMLAAAPCGCGSRLPAFRVEGRTDQPLALRSAAGALVRLPPLAISTVVEEAVGDYIFQVAQVGPDRLALRFAGAPPAAGRRAAAALRRWLEGQSLGNVAVSVRPGAPRVDARSGKVRSVVVERAP
jgi:phenylacetate-coenzyme A ligase PaaK-like adenylate-forming protein